MSGYVMNSVPTLAWDITDDTKSAADEIRDHVLTQQNAAIERAKELSKDAHDALKSLSRAANLAFRNVALTPPQDIPPPEATIDIGPITPEVFGKISPIGQRSFTVKGVGEAKAPDIKDFDPAFDAIHMPKSPGDPRYPTLPTPPVLKPVKVAGKPTLTRPKEPDLVELTIPGFTLRPLEPWSHTNPQFHGSSVSAVLQWAEKPYTPLLMDEEVAVIRRMWAGGTGLPPAVEQALWERAASREDIDSARQVSEAAIEFSARGYTLPPGALLARVDALREQGALRKQGLGREVMIKVADVHVENLRFACTQALAAENALISLWSQMAQRGLEFAKYQIDAELAVLNANIAIFNAQWNGVQMELSVRKMELEERNLELQQFKMQLDAELAKGQINEQRVRVYTEMFKGLMADLELYKGDLQAAQIEMSIQQQEIEKYKAQVQAAGEEVQIEKLKYDAYESAVKGESAKAALLESQARAYGAYVSGQAAKAEVAIKNQSAQIAVQDLELRAFLGQLEGDKAQLQAESAAISAAAEADRAATARFVAQAQAKTAVAELELKQWETQIRTNLAIFEKEVQKIIADMEQMIRVAALQADILKAVGQGHATLAAGAMAGVSLGASVSGGAGLSASGTGAIGATMTYSQVTELP